MNSIVCHQLTLRAVAETHTVMWYFYDDPGLSPRARNLIEEAASAGDQIGFSSITLAEVVYLSEKGRIHPQALGRVLSTLDGPGPVLRDLPLDLAVVAVMPSVDRNEVPDQQQTVGFLREIMWLPRAPPIP